jgi:hypothetical protein
MHPMYLEHHKTEVFSAQSIREVFYSWIHPREILATMARKIVSLLWMASAFLNLHPVGASYRVPRSKPAAKYTNRTFPLLSSHFTHNSAPL